MKQWIVTQASTRMVSYAVEAESEEQAIEAAKAAGTGSGVAYGPVDLWSAVPLEDVEPKVWIPYGWGTYCRNIANNVSDALALVRRCQESSIEWVALMVEGNNGYKVPLDATRTYAQTLQSAGIAVIVWTFPGDARAASVQESREAANLALSYAEEVGADAVLLDIEKPYKGKPEELRTLIETTEFGLGEGMSLGIVSFAVPSWHPTLDKTYFSLAHWGSPMIYDVTDQPATIEKAGAEWSALVAGPVIPSLWTQGNLASDIVRVFGESAPARFEGGIIWSEQQITAAQRVSLHASAQRYGWTDE